MKDTVIQRARSAGYSEPDIAEWISFETKQNGEDFWNTYEDGGEAWRSLDAYLRGDEDIVQFDVDEAEYLGSGEDGVYYQVARSERGYWYMTAVADSDAGNFVDTLVSDDGPFGTREAAVMGGRNAAYEWLTDNQIECLWCGKRLVESAACMEEKCPEEAEEISGEDAHG